MYNIPEIQKAFAGLVGFTQPDDPAYPKIDHSLTVSQSGKYVQSAHSLCTIENIYNSAPDFRNFVYPVFVANEPGIQTGETRRFNNALYTLIGTAAGETPVGNANWKPANPFSDWIASIYKAACSNLVSKLIETKKIRNAGKSLLDSQQLYSGFGMLNDRIIKRDRFVGFQLFTSRNQNTAINIARLGFQVDTPQTVNFYLYHSSQTLPVKVIPMTIARGSTFEWLDLSDVILSYMNGNQNSDGVFYLGYYESELQGQAIKKQMNISAAPCMTCNNYDISAYNAWSKYTAIFAMAVPEESLNDDRSLFDVSRISYVNDSNFGINLSISVYCDLTRFFATNKMLFADALSMQLAIEFLNKIAFATRINGNVAATKQTALAELNPDPKSKSFLSQYNAAIEALNYDFSGFDENCLPCAARSGISFETI